MNSLDMPPNLTGIAKSSRMAQAPGSVPLVMPQRHAAPQGMETATHAPAPMTPTPQQFDMASEPSVLSDGGDGMQQHGMSQAHPTMTHDAMQTPMQAPMQARSMTPTFDSPAMQASRDTPTDAKDRGRSMLVNGAIAVLIGAVAYNMPFHVQSYMNLVSRNGQYDEFRNRSYAVALAGICFLLAEVFNG